MATPKLFRLKAEVAHASSGPRASVLPVARVRVDTGVFHLDQLYDYAIPENSVNLSRLAFECNCPLATGKPRG